MNLTLLYDLLSLRPKPRLKTVFIHLTKFKLLMVYGKGMRKEIKNQPMQFFILTEENSSEYDAGKSLVLSLHTYKEGKVIKVTFKILGGKRKQ